MCVCVRVERIFTMKTAADKTLFGPLSKLSVCCLFAFCWSACHKALWLILGFSLLLLLLALLCADYLYFLLRSVIFAGCEWWRKRHCSSISSIFCFCFCYCWIIIIIITAIHKSKSARCLLHQRTFILSAFLPFSLSLFFFAIASLQPTKFSFLSSFLLWQKTGRIILEYTFKVDNLHSTHRDIWSN